MTLQIIELLAELASTLFTGAAVYITAIEHPARLSCVTQIAATEWAPRVEALPRGKRQTATRSVETPRCLSSVSGSSRRGYLRFLSCRFGAGLAAVTTASRRFATPVTFRTGARRAHLVGISAILLRHAGIQSADDFILDTAQRSVIPITS
jgi:hypothetical protein